jgi:hypothetical protein
LQKHEEFEISLYCTKETYKAKEIYGVPVYLYGERVLREDVVLPVCYRITPRSVEEIKKSDGKIIQIKYGNCLAHDLTTYTQYSTGLSPSYSTLSWAQKADDPRPDKLLYSPHFKAQKQYFSFLSNLPEHKVQECPYIWSPHFITKYAEAEKYSIKDLFFSRNDEKNKRAVALEPSISFLKTNLIPILTIEDLYSKDKEAIDHAYIMGTKNMRTSEASLEIRRKLNRLNSVKDGVTTFEDRHPLVFMLKEKARVQVSHQVMNALNYTYFEFAHFKLPFVHNSELLREYGYYYKESNLYDASDQLKQALLHEELSDSEIRRYNQACDEMLWTHSIENLNNLERYVELIKSVL